MVFNWRNSLIISLMLSAFIYCNPVCAQTYKVNSSSSVSRNVRSQTKAAPVDLRQDKNDTEDDDPSGNYFNNWSTVKQINVINRIGHKLISVSDIPADKQVKFSIARKYSANAYTDFCNNVVLHSGILNYAENEDELAFIIAKELVHVEQSHVNTKIARTVAVSVLVSAARFVTNTGFVPIKGGAIRNAKFSRNDEFKADKRGIDFLVAAGYNPLAAISILYKIGTNYVDFYQSHPNVNRRIYEDYMYIEANYPNYIQQGFYTQSYEYALESIKKNTSNKNVTVKSGSGKKKTVSNSNTKNDDE